MGTTKWNKKENMKIKRDKTKESFKKKDGTHTFTNLPTLPIVEGNTNMNEDKDETVDNITTEDQIDDILDSSIEESEKKLEERAKGLAETAKNIGKSFTNFNTLADRLFMEKYNEANLGKDVERLLTDPNAWIVDPDDPNNNSCESFEGSNEADVPDDMNTTSTNPIGSFTAAQKSKEFRREAKKGIALTLQYVKLYIKNIMILLQALPKLIILRLDFAVYGCRKLAQLFCEIIRTDVILESDLQKLFNQIDIIIYFFMVFVISYNWFFIFFFYEKQPEDAKQIENNMYKYIYVSTSKFINDNEAFPAISIKHYMESAGFFIKNVFSPIFYILSAVTFLFTEHSDKVGFTIPNILQILVTPFGFQILNSLPVKYLLTLVLFYYILEPSVHIIKDMAGFKIPNMAPGTRYASVIIYGLILILGILGIFEMFLGPDVYGFVKDIMSPIVEKMEDKVKEGTDDMTDAVNNLANVIGESVKEAKKTTMEQLLTLVATFLTFMLRCTSFFTLYSYLSVILFTIFIVLSLFPMMLFGSKNSFMNVNNAINNSNEPCFSYKTMLANFCGFINKRLFFAVMVMILGFSLDVYTNHLGNSSLKAGLFTVCGLLIIFFGSGFMFPDTVSYYLNSVISAILTAV
jgi:hypothetical protein